MNRTMNQRWISVTVSMTLAAVLSACAADVNIRKSDDFEMIRDTGGYRVAVMPFSVSADDDFFLIDALAAVGNIIALEGLTDSSPPLDKAGTYMRRAFVASLAGGPFQVAELWVTDTRLAHQNFTAEMMRDRKNARRIAELLHVDGVLYGDVYKWNRSYYVAETVQSVGLQVEIIDRRTEKSIYWAERKESYASGLSGGPTGYVSAATEPVAGLKGSTLTDLARSVARNAVEDLTGAKSNAQAQLDVEEARGDVPEVSFTSIVLEQTGPLKPGDKLTVVAIGTANAEVRFDIGRYRIGIPMVQKAVTSDPRGGRATYVGTYIVQDGEKLGSTPVYVSIRNKNDKQSVRSVRRIQEPLVTIGM